MKSCCGINTKISYLLSCKLFESKGLGYRGPNLTSCCILQATAPRYWRRSNVSERRNASICTTKLQTEAKIRPKRWYRPSTPQNVKTIKTLAAISNTGPNCSYNTKQVPLYCKAKCVISQFQINLALNIDIHFIWNFLKLWHIPDHVLSKTICNLQCFPHTPGHYKLRTNNCCISGSTSTLLEGTFRYLLAKPVEVHQSSGYWQALSERGYSLEHVFPIAAASILLRDVLAAGAAPSSTVASVECETSASPFWRSVYCSKMETKLISQVLSFSISMCVR